MLPLFYNIIISYTVDYSLCLNYIQVILLCGHCWSMELFYLAKFNLFGFEMQTLIFQSELGFDTPYSDSVNKKNVHRHGIFYCFKFVF